MCLYNVHIIYHIMYNIYIMCIHTCVYIYNLMKIPWKTMTLPPFHPSTFLRDVLSLFLGLIGFYGHIEKNMKQPPELHRGMTPPRQQQSSSSSCVGSFSASTFASSHPDFSWHYGVRKKHILDSA